MRARSFPRLDPAHKVLGLGSPSRNAVDEVARELGTVPVYLLPVYLCLRFDRGLTTAPARLEARWFATPFLSDSLIPYYMPVYPGARTVPGFVRLKSRRFEARASRRDRS